MANVVVSHAYMARELHKRPEENYANYLLYSTNLKELRLDAHLTQKELADIINCRQKDISRWETGQVPINKLKLLAIQNMILDYIRE